jgi:DNA end-binding protein Ku
MAQQLIGSLTAAFEPEKYHDEYRERVLELIEAKAAGEELVIQPEEEPQKVPDLMAALEQSLAAAQKSGGGTSRTRKRAASGDGGEPAKKPARRGGSRAKASKK